MPSATCRRLAAVLVLLLAVTACGGVPESLPRADGVEAAATAEPAPAAAPTEEPALESTLDWEECDAPFECATIAVPVDHAQPDGATIDLALIRLPAPAAADRIGSLVVNPGGPGGSGVDFVRMAAVDSIPAELRARFDIVGFDPRGVGGSSGISCGVDAVERFGEAFSTNLGTDLASVLAAARSLAASCGERGGELLAHVSTGAVVKDLDLLREALGDRTLSYLGYSYGTLIGAMYADEHPENVRALVLDGAVDPALDVAARSLDKAATAEAGLDEFFTWCAEARDCALNQMTDDPAGAFDDVVTALGTGSMPAAMFDDGRRLTRGSALFAISSLLGDREHGWPYLGVALADALEGDGSYFLAMFDSLSGREDEDLDAAAFDLSGLLAVNCLDVPAPAESDYDVLLADVEKVSPLFGAISLLWWAPCTYWPAGAVRTPAPISAAGSPPLVVIGTVNDAVTPYSWSRSLAAQLETGRLFTRDGDTHTAFGGDNVCTDRVVTRYFVDGVLPPEDTSCG